MRPSDPPPKLQKNVVAWLDGLLLGGTAMMCLAACLILSMVAWRTPEAVRAASLSAPTQAVLPPQAQARASPSATAPLANPTNIPSPTHLVVLSPVSPTATATRVVPGEPPAFTALGRKRIQLDLSEQTLTAYEGDTVMLTTLVSTGVQRHPTPIGEYKILRKVRIQAMSGPDYYVSNVEYVSYFLRGYAIHGTYWHDNFGHPMSHGCVNMRTEDAKWIYEWAPLGTPISVFP